MRARALEDGAVGQSIRLLNTASNRTIDAVVTGPGAARAQSMSKDNLMRTLALLALAAGAVGMRQRRQRANSRSDALAAPGVAYDAARRAMGPPQLTPVAIARTR